MTALSLQLPDSLHRQARKLAKEEGISVDQLVASALAEKLTALLQPASLEQRAARATRKKYLAALAQVPDVPPDPWDSLPAEPASPASGKGARGRKVAS